jgi:hypothetical protein
MALVEVPDHAGDRWWYPERSRWQVRSVLIGPTSHRFGRKDPAIATACPRRIAHRLFGTTGAVR